MLKVGLIGCGRIAPYHLKAFQAHPSVEIIGVCDLDKTKSNKYAEMFNCKSFYCIDDLLQNDLDLVSVTTGEDQHFMPVMKVLEAKTHVFVEKPLSIKLEEAKTMAKKASEVNVKLGVNYNRRMFSLYTKAKKIIDNGFLGEIAYINMKFINKEPKNKNITKYFFLHAELPPLI